MEQEIWKPIVGFEGYEVSDHGRVRSWHRQGPGSSRRKTPLMLSPFYSGGQKRVILTANKKKSNRTIARIVLTTFVGPCPYGRMAAHLDGDPNNNRLENLQWLSWEALSAHRRANGQVVPHRGASKLTDAQVLEIKGRLNVGESHQSIAEDFPVGWENIKSIHQEKAWTHVGTITRPFLPSRKHLTEAQRLRVVQGVRSGRTVMSVADELGCDFGTVSRVFAAETGMSVKAFKKKMNAA